MSNRHTFARLSFGAVIAIVGLSISMLSYAQSAEEMHEAPTGFGTITIEQKNISGHEVFSEWTLLKPGHEEQKRSSETTTIADSPAGRYVLLVEAPEGTSISMRMYKDGVLTQEVKLPQVSFQLYNGESVRVTITNNVNRVGSVSVMSDPAGIDFTLSAPNGFTATGTTPMTFQKISEGQVIAQYLPPEGCPKPAAKSQLLQAEERMSFAITMICEGAEKLRELQNVKVTSDTNVVITVDKKDVTLSDVTKDAWYAPFVFTVAKFGILAGYKDTNGIPDGTFRPGSNVTIAELAKIAHRIGGITEEAFKDKNPENPAALGQWHSPFIASAEQHGWEVYNDATVNPMRPATRAEVVATLMQAMDIPLKWQKAQMFTDVTLRTKYAAAIETAAADAIVEGRTDAEGKPLHLFGPLDPINRAEISRIIDNILRIYKKIDVDKKD
jgi:hypothetical protein